MVEEKLARCEGCGNLVSEDNLDRFGECSSCRALERATDMCVGDLNSK